MSDKGSTLRQSEKNPPILTPSKVIRMSEHSCDSARSCVHLRFDARLTPVDVESVHGGEHDQRHQRAEAGVRREKDGSALPLVRADPLHLRHGRNRQVVLAGKVRRVVFHKLFNGNDGSALVYAYRMPDQVRIVVR